MKEAKKETQRVRAYRAVLRGVTNADFIYKLRLGANYRARVCELRAEMTDKFGLCPDGDWIPAKLLTEKDGVGSSDNIYYFKLRLPQDVVNPKDPLALLPSEDRKSLTDAPVLVSNTQAELF